MSKKLRIAFMGTPDFAAIALRELCHSEHEVVCVYSQPPRPKGRGHKMQNSPVHDLADLNNIPVFTPKSLKSAAAKAEFAAHDIDVAIVAAYGLLLPEAVLNAPKYGCLNIHGSLLPRWRGASPIQQAIWHGDEKSGITIMQMDKGLDTGAMIARSEITLGEDMTAAKLHDLLAYMGAKLTLEVLGDLARDGKLEAQKQDEELVTYAHLLKKSDGIVDWGQSALQIDRQVRALNPFSVWADIGGKRFKILETELCSCEHDRRCGEVLSKCGMISCGQNTAIRLLKIQPSGKQAMDFISAVNGGYIDIEKLK